MGNVRICFEISELGVDENGLPCPGGMQIELGETEKAINYAEVTKNLDIPGILTHFGLKQIIKPENVRVISTEEYDKRFGD